MDNDWKCNMQIAAESILKIFNGPQVEWEFNVEWTALSSRIMRQVT